MRKIYIFRCDDGCEGIAGSWDKRKVIAYKAEHYDLFGHDGIISKEDEEVIES